jgi:hypothetical protein
MSRFRDEQMTGTAMDFQASDIIGALMGACTPGDIRVHFTALDDLQQGRTGCVDLAGTAPQRIVRYGTGPVLELGEMGDFDDCGANVFSMVPFAGQQLYYYQGWQRSQHAPYLIFTGVAAAEGDALRKLRRTPVLDRIESEPYMRAAPFVLADGAGLRMWYVHCERWQLVDGAPRYQVQIHTATSNDGFHWVTHPRACLQPGGDEYAVGRPWVVRGDGGYEMWFSIRSAHHPYRLGHAVSADGLHWVRSGPEVPLVETSGIGWDSEMVCYPCVLDHDGRRFMFYNGNRFGIDGVALAVENE